MADETKAEKSDETRDANPDEMKTGKPKLELVKSDPADIFNDLAALRKESVLTVKRKSVLVNVSVGKPNSNVYFRTNADPEMQLEHATVILASSGARKTFYYVTPKMRAHPKLVLRLRPVTIMVAVTWPASGPMLWPVPEITDFKAWKSEQQAARLGRTIWTMMIWDNERADFDIETAEKLGIEPMFPKESFNQLLKLGFADCIIDNEEHEYVRQLRGILD